MRFQPKKINDEIPTASMADITFLLIIFFMVTNTFAATRGLDFAVPKEERNPPSIEREESVLISVRQGGQIDVDGKPMALGEILQYLRPKLERNPLKPVILRPDPEAAYGDMVRVYDVLRGGKDNGLEIKNISIPTQREIEQFWY